MWNCQKCGCKNIAAGLPSCPMCGKESEMGKATTSGPSVGTGPDDTAQEAPEEPQELDPQEDQGETPEDTPEAVSEAPEGLAKPTPETVAAVTADPASADPAPQAA